MEKIKRDGKLENTDSLINYFDYNAKIVLNAYDYFKKKLFSKFGFADSSLERIYAEKYEEINNSLSQLKDMDTLFNRYESYRHIATNTSKTLSSLRTSNSLMSTNMDSITVSTPCIPLSIRMQFSAISGLPYGEITNPNLVLPIVNIYDLSGFNNCQRAALQLGINALRYDVGLPCNQRTYKLSAAISNFSNCPSSSVGGGTNPTTGGGGGGSTSPKDPTPPNTLSPVSVTSFNNQIKNKPFALMPSDIDCDIIKQWIAIAKFTPSQDIITKLNKIVSANTTDFSSSATRNPSFGLEDVTRVQSINNAYSNVVNMDYFPINVTKLPNGFTAETFQHFIRVNLNTLVNNKAVFTPYQWYGTNDVDIWNSSKPYGAVVAINIAGPDNGSVVVSNVNAIGWIFTTIQDPYEGTHPVSGNRQFGFIPNANGGYTYYIRGVDRLTDIYGSILQWSTKLPFSKADALWSSLQIGILGYVNSHGGKASLNTFTNDLDPGGEHKYVTNSYQYFRPNWKVVKDVIDGKKPLSTLSTDCL